MQCERCRGHGDPFGGDGDWRPLHEDATRTVRPMLECARCGNRQRLR